MSPETRVVYYKAEYSLILNKVKIIKETTNWSEHLNWTNCLVFAVHSDETLDEVVNRFGYTL